MMHSSQATTRTSQWFTNDEIKTKFVHEFQLVQDDIIASFIASTDNVDFKLYLSHHIMPSSTHVRQNPAGPVPNPTHPTRYAMTISSNQQRENKLRNKAHEAKQGCVITAQQKNSGLEPRCIPQVQSMPCTIQRRAQC